MQQAASAKAQSNRPRPARPPGLCPHNLRREGGLHPPELCDRRVIPVSHLISGLHFSTRNLGEEQGLGVPRGQDACVTVRLSHCAGSRRHPPGLWSGLFSISGKVSNTNLTVVG